MRGGVERAMAVDTACSNLADATDELLVLVRSYVAEIPPGPLRREWELALENAAEEVRDARKALRPDPPIPPPAKGKTHKVKEAKHAN